MVDPLNALMGSRTLNISAAAGAYADLIKEIIFYNHPLDPYATRAILAEFNAHTLMALAWINQQTPPPPTSTCTGAGTGWCLCPPDTEDEEDTAP